MKIVFDLDGTLICSKKRLYELFCDLTESRFLDFEQYWELKLQGENNQNILRSHFFYSDVKVEEFTSRWMSEIESDYYLSMDSAIDGVDDFLKKAGEKNKLYICTARQSASQARIQLKNLYLLDFFEEIYVTEQKLSKEELMFRSGIDFSGEDWFVGDTGHDINTGKKIGIKTCAVLSGFMSRSALEDYKPDLILNNVTLLGAIL